MLNSLTNILNTNYYFKGGLTMKTIGPNILAEKLRKNEEVVILDVRAVEKYNDYHIKEENTDTINIEKSLIFALGDGGDESKIVLPKNKEIIVTCTTGNSARKCAMILAEKEYNVILLEGGITAWKEFKKG